MVDLEHPDVTCILRTGEPPQAAGSHRKCGECGEEVVPGHEKWGYLLEYDGKMLCRDCFEEAVQSDLSENPVAFAQSLLLRVEKF